MRNRQRMLYTACAFAIGMNALAGTVYQNDFETNTGSEWTDGRIDFDSASGKSFLGRYIGNESATLNLSNLTAHTGVTVAFDLYVIGSWDGYRDANEWSLTIDNTSLINTNFCNGLPSWGMDYSQAWPANVGNGYYLSRTGSVESWITAFPYYSGGYQDGVRYHISTTMAHNSDSLSILFAGRNLEDLGNESWGIDNLTVTTDAVPGPIAAAPYLAGLLLMRRKRNTAK